MADDRIEFYSWDEAFGLVGQIEELHLVTNEVSGGKHWVLAGTGPVRLFRSGKSLKALSEAVTEYFSQEGEA